MLISKTYVADNSKMASIIMQQIEFLQEKKFLLLLMSISKINELNWRLVGICKISGIWKITQDCVFTAEIKTKQK